MIIGQKEGTGIIEPGFAWQTIVTLKLIQLISCSIMVVIIIYNSKISLVHTYKLGICIPVKFLTTMQCTYHQIILFSILQENSKI